MAAIMVLQSQIARSSIRYLDTHIFTQGSWFRPKCDTKSLLWVTGIKPVSYSSYCTNLREKIRR
jgi:hypothetical protein